MTGINFVGQQVDATWTPPAIVTERRVYFGHSYCGLLTQHRGIGWTHSIQRHGTPAFASPDLAEADFWLTKSQLPQEVHKAIFGHEQREVRP